MRNYRLSAEASRDLARIWDYLEEAAGEQTANRMIARLTRSFEYLAEYPYAGAQRDYLPGIRLYPASHTPYVILYFPGEPEMEISRVIHGSQDIKHQFR